MPALFPSVQARVKGTTASLFIPWPCSALVQSSHSIIKHKSGYVCSGHFIEVSLALWSGEIGVGFLGCCVHPLSTDATHSLHFMGGAVAQRWSC